MSTLENAPTSPIHFMAKPAEIERTRRPLNEASHAPGYVYGDPDVLRLEKERIFMKDWLCVAHLDELPNPGDFMTHTVIDEPVLIVRNRSGVLQAFYNQCRHRGVEVAEGKGNTKIFKCPYHAWSYDLDGKLIGVPFMKEAQGFDQKQCSLKPVRLDTWGGFIYISFDPQAESLSSYMAEYEQEFGMLRQGDLRLGLKWETDFDCNWKFVYENLMDIYHVGVTHADTIGRYQDQSSYRYLRLPRGRASIHYRAKTMSATGSSLFGRLPWIDDDSFARIGYLPPNLTMLARCDYVRPVTHWPTAVNKTHSVAYFLFPEDRIADPRFQEKIQTYAKFVEQVLDEDRGMILSLQRAMNTRGFEPGRMSFMEDAIHHALAWHLERLFGPQSA
ncbi:aromatic ring-hydroxylating dioxygenase subunit alpha [Burkholderia multivorans]|nr:aromatic ring-hydroxylating dioxygenase subunit alpha [Burkholderia multivorans]